jgi:hypothetical protein
MPTGWRRVHSFGIVSNQNVESKNTRLKAQDQGMEMPRLVELLRDRKSASMEDLEPHRLEESTFLWYS